MSLPTELHGDRTKERKTMGDKFGRKLRDAISSCSMFLLSYTRSFYSFKTPFPNYCPSCGCRSRIVDDKGFEVECRGCGMFASRNDDSLWHWQRRKT